MGVIMKVKTNAVSHETNFILGFRVPLTFIGLSHDISDEGIREVSD